MGVTIAYRGRLADLTRIEDFEDRLFDFALEMGGMAQIWRTWADDNPERMVRGIILDLAPGHESTSLLISPEGWLIGLVDIEDAENGRLNEPPWCFVKTQFGPIEGHVALVEMFTALKCEFLPDLEVSDEGGYWETRDFAELARRKSFLQSAIDGLAEGLSRYGLSHEAAEDPEILLRHVERVAAQVHRTLRRPSEHPPVAFEEGEFEGAVSPEVTEKQWDELFKQNRRQQERLQRAIEELRSRGVDDATALRDALREVVPDSPDEETEEPDEPWRDDEHSLFGQSAEDLPAGEDAGLPEAGDEGGFTADEDERHPLLQQAMDLFVRLDTIFPDEDPRIARSLGTLYQGVGDAMGGLAQALSSRDDDEDEADDFGLSVVQLKRALRGAAFARGALFPLRSALSKEQFDDLYQTLERMQTDIVSELGRVRDKRRGDDA
jgi:hypothetical protein